jgi:hypothetical protein
MALDKMAMSEELSIMSGHIRKIFMRIMYELAIDDNLDYDTSNLSKIETMLQNGANGISLTDEHYGFRLAKSDIDIAMSLIGDLLLGQHPIFTSDETKKILSIKQELPSFISAIDTEMNSTVTEELPTENYDMQNVASTSDSITSTQDNLGGALGSNPSILANNTIVVAEENAAIDNVDIQLSLATDPAEVAALTIQKDTLVASATPTIGGGGFADKLKDATGVDGGLLQSQVSDSLGSFKIAGVGANDLLGDTMSGVTDLLGPIDKGISAVTGILGGTDSSSACAGLNLGGIADSIGSVFSGAKSFLSKGVGGLTSGLKGIEKGIGNALGDIGDALSDPLGSLKKAGKGIASGIKGAATLIGKGFGGAAGFLKKGLGDIGTGISGALSDPLGGFSGVMNGIKGIIGKLPGMISGCGLAKARCVSSNLGALGPSIKPKLKAPSAACGEELGGVLGAVAGKVKGVADFLDNAEANLNKKVIGMAKDVIGDFAGDSGIGKTLGDAASGMLGSAKENTSISIASALPSGIGGEEGPTKAAENITESIMSCKGVNEISLTATIENARVKILEYIANIEDHPDTLKRDLAYLPKVRADINANYYLKPAGNLQSRMSTTRFYLAYSVYVTNLFNGITKEDIEHYSHYQYIVDNVKIIKQTRDDLANYLQTQIGLCAMTEVEKTDKLADDLKSNLSVTT